jgi:hypothetical protein
LAPFAFDPLTLGASRYDVCPASSTRSVALMAKSKRVVAHTAAAELNVSSRCAASRKLSRRCECHPRCPTATQGNSQDGAVVWKPCWPDGDTGPADGPFPGARGTTQLHGRAALQRCSQVVRHSDIAGQYRCGRAAEPGGRAMPLKQTLDLRSFSRPIRWPRCRESLPLLRHLRARLGNSHGRSCRQAS